MSEEGKLTEVVGRIYERQRRQVRISPSSLATQTMVESDPDNLSPHIVAIAAHLQFRHIARSFCRTRFEDNSNPQQDDLPFPGLQDRYPIAHSKGEEPIYVKRDYMEERDVEFNVKRLRSEGNAKLKHADALDAWWQSRGR